MQRPVYALAIVKADGGEQFPRPRVDGDIGFLWLDPGKLGLYQEGDLEKSGKGLIKRLVQL